MAVLDTKTKILWYCERERTTEIRRCLMAETSV